jgi:hypothetical protein
MATIGDYYTAVQQTMTLPPTTLGGEVYRVLKRQAFDGSAITRAKLESLLEDESNSTDFTLKPSLSIISFQKGDIWCGPMGTVYPWSIVLDEQVTDIFVPVSTWVLRPKNPNDPSLPSPFLVWSLRKLHEQGWVHSIGRFSKARIYNTEIPDVDPADVSLIEKTMPILDRIEEQQRKSTELLSQLRGSLLYRFAVGKPVKGDITATLKAISAGGQ